VSASWRDAGIDVAEREASPKDTTHALARAFAVHLDHLRRFRGVGYVSGDRLSRLVAEPTDTEPTGQPAGGPEPEGEAASTAAKVDASKARREQARTWSVATKLEYLRQHNLGNCQRCQLARTRANLVFGVGDGEADLMLVGEAPGADEDRQGEPFVGRAGQRLTEWIEACGLTRERVYICNVLKCRPPGNRDPLPAEVDRCSPFLRAQIRAIAPRVIVALGRHAGMFLSGTEHLSLRQMRGTQLTYEDDKANVRIPLIVTYHPAYALRRERGARATDATSVDELAVGDLRRALAVAGVDC
jgi:DNA polymerase